MIKRADSCWTKNRSKSPLKSLFIHSKRTAKRFTMDQAALLKTFQEITGLNDQESRFMLEAHNWDVEEAFETHSASNPKSIMRNPPSLFADRPISPSASNPVEIPPPSSSSKPAPKKTGRIAGFSDFGREEEDDTKQKYYTGGDKSGLQVEAPTSSNQNFADNLFKAAQEQGAKSVEKDGPFAGSSYHLGSAAGSSKKNEGKTERPVITFWKNGFSLNDGPLRSFTDPANFSFLNAIKMGKVPPELNHTGADSDVEILDKRGEEYKAPPPPPFAGSGQKLGGISASSSSSSSNNNNVSYKVELKDSEPSTSIQIRLADGSRLVGKFNLSHKVVDIRAHINSTKNTTQSYSLMTSMPQKLLEDENQTIQEAGLQNAVVIQKLN
eukprot:TRINITY_DN2406_c0_g1_i1.p1 TRINITY_DN2406_c0_g1~~TRINITY_DN2406_c0_g1_i1.p1  ORF type:complete len:382 (+),score=173.03 TRINITY_DN2406_c0_g1_i1:144-1289(+)